MQHVHVLMIFDAKRAQLSMLELPLCPAHMPQSVAQCLNDWWALGEGWQRRIWICDIPHGMERKMDS